MGLSYISKTGFFGAERTLKEPCNELCANKCAFNITVEHRQQILEKFWQSTKYDKHLFYSKNIDRIKTKRKMSKNTVSRRTYSFIYYFHLNEEKFKVCQKFFLNTLCIDSHRVLTYFSKFHNEATGQPKPIVEQKRKPRSQELKKQ